ncbi:Cutinase [Macrophomina phaseolina MS6]|uniref:Cutinase n=1 Tax=Macrophomina phaseolina (strain MS6) TaxID=1126212 RepID=K2RTV3_MACPH|nr:Cutinase [Macrophomina phaseolina MS6]
MLFSLPLLSLFHLAYGQCDQAASYFRSSLSPESQVFVPSTPDYSENVVERWNTYPKPSFALAIKPNDETDVQKIVNYSRQNNVSILAIGGGHGGSTTLNSVRDGILIDLSHFSRVNVSADRNLMAIGGAVRFRDVMEPLQRAGKEMPVGSCSCVGMTSAAMGGGIGALNGKYGLMLDSLESVRMVVGTGEILTASATEHPDLFWGVRGAGHNLGIVTSSTFRVYDATNGGIVLNADMRFAPATNRSVFQVLESFAHAQPDELALTLSWKYDAEGCGGTCMLLNAIFSGSSEDGMRLLRPFLELEPYAQNISTVSWSSSLKVARFGADSKACTTGRSHSVWSGNLYVFDTAAFGRAFDYYDTRVLAGDGKLDDSGLTLTMNGVTGITAVPDDNTAYAHRDARAFFYFDIKTKDQSISDQADDMGRGIRTILASGSASPSAELDVYVNFAHGDEDPSAVYGERKLPKLKSLVAKYDPDRLFGHFNSI